MKLLTKAIEAKLPQLYATEKVALEDKVLAVKFFTPDGGWTWFGVEYDPKQRLFFGYVEGMEKEWGYFSLEELEGGRGQLGLPIERDKFWQPITYGDWLKSQQRQY